jgi:hypothetical protein
MQELLEPAGRIPDQQAEPSARAWANQYRSGQVLSKVSVPLWSNLIPLGLLVH